MGGRFCWPLGVALLVVIADQVSKSLMIGLLAPDDAPVSLALTAPGIEVTSFFNLVMAWNCGVSFGMFSHCGDTSRFVLSGLAVLISTALLIWLRSAEGGWLRLAIGLVIGGALGNVIDRLVYGAVFDFLDFHYAGWHFPAFNVADSAITVGTAIILILATLPEGSAKGAAGDTDQS